MGYEPEDLPWEVPLIELGLDSLMAVRIKNRVEYDFDLPPIQLQAVRDANLYNVEKLISYAIEHRDEVAQLHQFQQTASPEEVAKAQAELLGGATTAAEIEQRLAEVHDGDPIVAAEAAELNAKAADTAATMPVAAAADAIRCAAPAHQRCAAPAHQRCAAPAHQPSGPVGRDRDAGAAGRRRGGPGPDLAAAAAVLNQQAVAEALNSDVPAA